MRNQPVAVTASALVAIALAVSTMAAAQTAATPGGASARPGTATGAAPGGGATPRSATGRGPGAPSAGGGGNVNRTPLMPCDSVTVDPPTILMLGKSQIVRLLFPVSRIIVGGQSASPAGAPAGPSIASTQDQLMGTLDQRAPGMSAAQREQVANALRPAPTQPAGQQWDGVADTQITLLSPTELFFLGRKPGSMNVVLQGNDGRCVVKDLVVTIDPGTLQGKLGELMPDEKGIVVRGADHSYVLTGTVSDTIKLDHAMSLAMSYGDGKKVVNLLRVTAPQQVMLEVKIAEVSKTVLDRLNFDFARGLMNADGTVARFFQGLLGGGPILASQVGGLRNALIGSTVTGGVGNNAMTGPLVPLPSGELRPTAGTSASSAVIDAQKKDGIIRVLAEPNIMAISGQQASFLSGGKILIPVEQTRDAIGRSITLEEKEFGVGLKFTPTVLDGNRINLKLVSEVSELSQTGSPFTSINGVTAILPAIAIRKIDTTVQLGDGQSFLVAGVIKNNMNEALSKFPGLGEVPVMGALFRSSEFQTDQTELMFVVTPRLVKPLATAVALPTDNHIVPNRNDVMLLGTGEGTAPAAPAPAPARP